MKKRIDIAGRNIFYGIYGKGKPVMLVHGFGETSEVWSRQVEHLGNKFLLIVPDLPGSGQSDLIDDMSVEGMAAILKAILHNESISNCVMVGHSMGGYITLAFVEKYQSYLSAFGLFHSTSFPDTEEKIATRRKGIEFISEHGAFEFLKNTTPNLFSAITKTDTPEMVSRFVNSLEDFSAAALVAYYEAMIRRPDRTQILKGSTIPVLFIMGKYDSAVPLEDGLKQCYWPQQASINILHRSGHLGMLEEKQKANEILEQFLTS